MCMMWHFDFFGFFSQKKTQTKQDPCINSEKKNNYWKKYNYNYCLV